MNEDKYIAGGCLYRASWSTDTLHKCRYIHSGHLSTFIITLSSQQNPLKLTSCPCLPFLLSPSFNKGFLFVKKGCFLWTKTVYLTCIELVSSTTFLFAIMFVVNLWSLNSLQGDCGCAFEEQVWRCCTGRLSEPEDFPLPASGQHFSFVDRGQAAKQTHKTEMYCLKGKTPCVRSHLKFASYYDISVKNIYRLYKSGMEKERVYLFEI